MFLSQISVTIAALQSAWGVCLHQSKASYRLWFLLFGKHCFTQGSLNPFSSHMWFYDGGMSYQILSEQGDPSLPSRTHTLHLCIFFFLLILCYLLWIYIVVIWYIHIILTPNAETKISNCTANRRFCFVLFVLVGDETLFSSLTLCFSFSAGIPGLVFWCLLFPLSSPLKPHLVEADGRPSRVWFCPRFLPVKREFFLSTVSSCTLRTGHLNRREVSMLSVGFLS